MRTTSILLALFLVLPLAAQAPLAGPDAYRRTKEVATATFLDKSRPDAERLRATADMGYPDARTMERLLAVGRDRSESDAIRWEALRRVRVGDAFFDVVLQILDDPRDGGAELDANLINELGRRITRRTSAEIKRRVIITVRKLLTDRRDSVRLAAYRFLASNHDQVAVNNLVDAMRRGGAPIPLPEAIDLLDQDGTTNHIGVLRRFLEHDDANVQSKAVRALALDPESRPRIVAMATSSNTRDVVRVNALRGLARDDEKFPSYALPIVENRGESPEIRYAAMHSFAGRMNYNEVADADQVRFARAVEALAADTGLHSNRAEFIRAEARALLEYLKKAFPAVRRAYGIP